MEKFLFVLFLVICVVLVVLELTVGSPVRAAVAAVLGLTVVCFRRWSMKHA